MFLELSRILHKGPLELLAQAFDKPLDTVSFAAGYREGLDAAGRAVYSATRSAIETLSTAQPGGRDEGQ